jgi:hypothetical protein
VECTEEVDLLVEVVNLVDVEVLIDDDKDFEEVFEEVKVEACVVVDTLDFKDEVVDRTDTELLLEVDDRDEEEMEDNGILVDELTLHVPKED